MMFDNYKIWTFLFLDGALNLKLVYAPVEALNFAWIHKINGEQKKD